MSAILDTQQIGLMNNQLAPNTFAFSLPYQLFSKISASYIAADTWHQGIAQSLSTFGKGTGLQKIQVVDCSNPTNLLMICEWQKTTSLQANKKSTQLIQPVFWENAFRALADKNFHTITPDDQLTDTETLYLRLSHAQKIWTIPLIFEERMAAFLVLEQCDKNLHLPEPDFLYLINLIQDITQAKFQREKEKAETKKFKNRYEIISRATNDALYDWDIISDKVWRNDTARILFGCYDDASLASTHWWHNNIHPSDKTRVIESLKDVLKFKKKFWTSEYRFECASGLYKHVLDQAYIEYDDAGTPYRRIGSMRDISKHKLLEETANQNKEELRNLARKLQTAKEDERKKLSQELHDDVAQTLVALKMNLDWIERKSSADNLELHKVISDSAEISSTLMQKIKQLAIELRPKLIDDLGLSESIKWQIDEYERKIAFKYDIHQEIDDVDIDLNLSVEIFRIFQEVMNNIFKHAKAKSVYISLRVIDNCIILNIKDDGCGFDQTKLCSDEVGIGLLGIKERVFDHNGLIRINSQLQKGTSIYLSIPV